MPPPSLGVKHCAGQKARFEKARVKDALKQTGGNRTEAARILGISRRMLQKKLIQFDLR